MRAGIVNINKSIQAISVYLVHSICEEENCSEETALKKLLKTKTYELLQDRIPDCMQSLRNMSGVCCRMSRRGI